MKNIIRFFMFFSIACFLLGAGIKAEAQEPMPFLEEKEADVPIIMYHFIRDAGFGRWDISATEFEEDLLYLKHNGYTTVTMQDLTDFVFYGEDLPEKPIVLTFDDGDTSVYKYVLPLLKKHDMKISLSILGKVTDEYSKSELEEVFPNTTWAQLKEMHDTGLVEIANHSYDLHSGIGARKKDGESKEDYEARLIGDLSKLEDQINANLGPTPKAFTYPFGSISEASDEILRENGFLASLSCYEVMNTIKSAEPETLFSLGRFLRPHGVSAESFFEQFETKK